MSTAPTKAKSRESAYSQALIQTKLIGSGSDPDPTQKPSEPEHQLIHERCDESKGGFSKGVKRSSGPISRIPGGDRVAANVGVVQMEKVNDIRRRHIAQISK